MNIEKYIELNTKKKQNKYFTEFHHDIYIIKQHQFVKCDRKYFEKV